MKEAYHGDVSGGFDWIALIGGGGEKCGNAFGAGTARVSIGFGFDVADTEVPRADAECIGQRDGTTERGKTSIDGCGCQSSIGHRTAEA